MSPRVLVCLEDPGVAHVVAARLMRDGVDGVVVDKPGRLVDEAKKGAAALAVQDRYPSGEAATSLLRQIRVARSEAVPAVVLLTGEIPQGDRLVLEKQYKVKEFIRIAESPLRIAQAAAAAAGREDTGRDLSGRDPPGRDPPGRDPPGRALPGNEVGDGSPNEFDVSLESVAQPRPAMLSDESIDIDAEPKTVKFTAEQLQQLREEERARALSFEGIPKTVSDALGGTASGPTSDPDAAPRGDEATGTLRPPLVREHEGGGLHDLSELPPPGGDADLDFFLAPEAGATSSPPVSAPSAVVPVNAVSTSVVVPNVLPPAAKPRTEEKGDSVQMQPQDFQKAQNELKKALLNERKLREAAQKRVEELEARLARVGDGPARPTGGVPAEGIFEDIRYPTLLARCRADAFTGAIVMQSGGATRNVYLRDGLPIAFHSSEPGERIGKVLVTQGRITDEQYMKATTRSVERSIKLTDALVELGWMDAETIAMEQRNLARDQIIQSFELVQGRFSVKAGAAPDANTVTFDFGPGEIYVQGYRRYAPTSEMLAAYETFRDKYLVANARLAAFRPKLGLVSDDERLLRLLGEALTVEEAVDRARLPIESAARLLSALQALELVEEWSPGVEQFRSRLRSERQRHAEEIAQLHSDARAREERLLQAFEKALARGGSSLDGAASSAPSAPEPKNVSAERASNAAAPINAAAPSSAAAAPPPSSPPATSAPPPSLATSPVAAAAATAAPPAAAPEATSAPSKASSASEASSPAASLPRTPSLTVSSSDGAAGLVAAREAPPALTIADVKYREGVEQAAQNRLDEAEVTLREAVRLDASKPEYLTSLARVLLANPRYERSGTLPVVRSLLDRAVQIAPQFKEAADLHAQVIKEMAGPA